MLSTFLSFHFPKASSAALGFALNPCYPMVPHNFPLPRAAWIAGLRFTSDQSRLEFCIAIGYIRVLSLKFKDSDLTNNLLVSTR